MDKRVLLLIIVFLFSCVSVSARTYVSTESGCEAYYEPVDCDDVLAMDPDYPVDTCVNYPTNCGYNYCVKRCGGSGFVCRGDFCQTPNPEDRFIWNIHDMCDSCSFRQRLISEYPGRCPDPFCRIYDPCAEGYCSGPMPIFEYTYSNLCIPDIPGWDCSEGVRTNSEDTCIYDDSVDGCSGITDCTDSECDLMDYYEDWSYYCRGDDLWRHKQFNDYSCGSDGCYLESSDYVDEEYFRTCRNGCDSGECIPPTSVECFDDSDCGVSGLTDSTFCRDGDVYQSHVFRTCYEPGSWLAHCGDTTTDELVDSCTGSEICSGGACVPTCTPDWRCRDSTRRGYQNSDCSWSSTTNCEYGCSAGSCNPAPAPSDCHSGSLGGWTYCSDFCPCDVGEGDCDRDSQCNAGLVCADNVGPSYGWATGLDVCETPGGSGSGSDCHSGSLGGWNYCSSDCPCTEGQGDCDSDSECNAGLTCSEDVGASYGFSSTVDVCESPGSPGGSSSDCHSGSPGDYSYCRSDCPCDAGEGDCDGDTQCLPGLTCSNNVGASYGWSSGIDVCELAGSFSSCHSGSPGDYSYCSTSCPCSAREGDCDNDSECDAGLRCIDDVGTRYGFGSLVDVCESDSGSTPPSDGSVNHCSDADSWAPNWCSDIEKTYEDGGSVEYRQYFSWDSAHLNAFRGLDSDYQWELRRSADFWDYWRVIVFQFFPNYCYGNYWTNLPLPHTDWYSEEDDATDFLFSSCYRAGLTAPDDFSVPWSVFQADEEFEVKSTNPSGLIANTDYFIRTSFLRKVPGNRMNIFTESEYCNHNQGLIGLCGYPDDFRFDYNEMVRKSVVS